MKKYILIIVSLIIMILTFLNNWYSDKLLDLLFVPALNIILFISLIICLIIVLIKIIKYKQFINIIALVFLIITVLMIISFPTREEKFKLTFNLYEKDRLEIIKMIKDNKLKSDEYGNTPLPRRYKKLSSSGEVVVLQNNEEQLIIFWIFRGMQSGSVELIYSTGGEKLIKENEGGHPIVSIDKLKDKWYYVKTDY